MKKIALFLIITMMVGACFAAGCATSYQDRLDALNTENPPQDQSPPVDTGGSEDTTISRDDIPLSGACLVNANCNSHQFCELGRCISECSKDVLCPVGLFCSARGKCISDQSYVDVDPEVKATPPVDWSVDKHVVKLDTGKSSASFHVQVNGGGALQYRIQVEPREAQDAVTISEPEGVVASGGAKELTVTVDRSVLGDGDHRISVNVISDGGQKMVIFELSNGLSGRYGGYVEYTNPGLGRVPLVLDLKTDSAGKISGRIVTAGSLLFPVERSITGTVDSAHQTIFLSMLDRMEKGGDYDPFERPIGREIYIYGAFDEQRMIKGQFEEMVSGLLPQVMTISGEISLTRTNTDVDDIIAHVDPLMPAFPNVATSYSACSGFSESCKSELNFRSNMIGCSAALRGDAFKLGTSFSSTSADGQPVVNFGLVEQCKADVASLPNAIHPCVNIDDLVCLGGDQQNYLLKAIAQDSEYGQYFEDLKSVERLYAFIGNDYLIDAYRTSVEEVSNPLSTELSRLEQSLDQYEKAERAFFGAANIAVMNRAGVAALSANAYDLFRVPLQYIASSQSALKQVVSMTLRRDLGKSDRRAELRQRIQNHARVIFFEGLALAHLISLSGGDFKNELGQIADELHSVASTQDTLEASANPLGFADDYVPFIYDPSDGAHPTNFSQLIEMASHAVESAVQKAKLAENSTELMEEKIEEIKRQMEDVEQSFEGEIQRICGVDSLDILGECGQSGGELALAFNDIEQQYLEIEKINQQIMDLNQMVKIKRDAALQIMNAKGKTLMFLESSGAKQEALDMAAAEVQMAMLRKRSVFGVLGGIVSGIKSIAGGILAAKDGDVGGAIGGIAGGISGLVNEGMGGTSGARSADAAWKLGNIDRQKTNIKNLQQMRFQEEGMEIATIQAAEEVKLLLLQMAQLNLDLELADVRLSQQVIKANNLIDRVDFLKHQRDVLLAQALESVNNPLSNLSFRLRRDHSVLMAYNEFEKALSDVYLAARGLEHELNIELPQITSQLFQTNSAYQLADFLTCLNGWSDDYRIAFGSPHEEVTQISLRKDVLGFTNPVTDEVTGKVTSPEELFRRVLFDPKHITQTGRVEFPFVTSIAGGDKQFSTLVCNDRIGKIRVMLVGDFLGDNETTVMLRQEGNSYVRDCSSDPAGGNDSLNTYHLDERNALVQAGVNSFGLSSPNFELTGRSVASDRWVLVIPTGTEAPNNKDVDFLMIDDVVIEITHEARTLNSGSPTSVFGQCNI